MQIILPVAVSGLSCWGNLRSLVDLLRLWIRNSCLVRQRVPGTAVFPGKGNQTYLSHAQLADVTSQDHRVGSEPA